MDNNFFSKELDILLKYITFNLMEELPSLTVTPEYLILGILLKGDSMANKLLRANIPAATLLKINEAFFESINRKTLKAKRPNAETKFNEACENIFQRAFDDERIKIGGDKINSLHVLLALVNPENGEPTIAKVFESAHMDYNAILNAAKEMMDHDNGDDENYEPHFEEPEPPINNIFGIKPMILPINNNGNPNDFQKMMGAMLGVNPNIITTKKNSVAETFCTNLNAKVEKGEIDDLIGREKELNQVINVLGRKKKNNVIIVGGDGVGKTALCEGLAYKIVHGDVPSFLADKTIWSLNLASLIAGTQFRGLLEERIQNLIKDLSKDKKNILYFDDISVVFADKKNADVDFSTIITSALMDNSLQIMGCCGFKGYRTTFDSNPSLARKFQKIIIEEPSDEDAIHILESLKPSYEKYHHVSYDKGIEKLCVQLAKRYLPERHLPDSAIDIFDEVGSREHIKSCNNDKILSLRKEIKNKESIVSELKKDEKFDEANDIKKEISTLTADLKKEMKDIENNASEHPILVTEEMLYSLISDKTGIPIQQLSNDDKQNVLKMGDVLKQSIIGQDEAVDTVCRAIKRNRVGFGGKKTMGAFLLCGRTGLGKTLLAKQLAKQVFGDEKYLVRIDMSEYEDKTAVNKLIGSSAGYVGYENGGVLTETIKNKKYCVLLLDEFEKADPEIYNLFLQVFDEGYLNDNTGQKIDFKNTIIILTSNIGAKMANDFGRGIGFEDIDKSKAILENEMKKKFSPEFLNRLDDIVYFNALTDDNLKKIIKLEMGKLFTKLKTIGHSLSFDDSVIDFIFNKIEDRDYGARPIIRIIQDYVENPITDLLLENDYSNHIFKITCFPGDEKLTIA